MGNAEQILVVILSSALAVFLILAIAATIKLIQLLDSLKRISDKAEKLAETAESVSEFFKYTAGPAALGKLVANVTEVFRKRKRKDEE